MKSLIIPSLVAAGLILSPLSFADGHKKNAKLPDLATVVGDGCTGLIDETSFEGVWDWTELDGNMHTKFGGDLEVEITVGYTATLVDTDEEPLDPLEVPGVVEDLEHEFDLHVAGDEDFTYDSDMVTCNDAPGFAAGTCSANLDFGVFDTLLNEMIDEKLASMEAGILAENLGYEEVTFDNISYEIDEYKFAVKPMDPSVEEDKSQGKGKQNYFKTTVCEWPED